MGPFVVTHTDSPCHRPNKTHEPGPHQQSQKTNPSKTTNFHPNPIKSMDGPNPPLSLLETQRINWLTDHGEHGADPESMLAMRTHRHVASVNGDHVCRNVPNGAAADERRVLDTGHWQPWQRGRRQQPIRLFVATGVVADVVEVAEHEVHRAEPLQARPGRPYTRARHSVSSVRAGWS